MIQQRVYSLQLVGADCSGEKDLEQLTYGQPKVNGCTPNYGFGLLSMINLWLSAEENYTLKCLMILLDV